MRYVCANRDPSYHHGCSNICLVLWSQASGCRSDGYECATALGQVIQISISPRVFWISFRIHETTYPLQYLPSFFARLRSYFATTVSWRNAMRPARQPPIVMVEPRYIDRAKLTELLARLFPAKSYAAEVRPRRYHRLSLRRSWLTLGDAIGSARNLDHIDTYTFNQGMYPTQLHYFNTICLLGLGLSFD